jgi:hypothetical protein
LIFKCIRRALFCHSIKFISLPLRKIPSCLASEGWLGLRPLRGVCSIPYECGQVSIGQTGHLIHTRLKEHYQHIQLKHPEKLAIVEHNNNLGQHIQLHHTTISTKPRYMDHIIRVAIEIELHPNNMNKEDVFCLSKSYPP